MSRKVTANHSYIPAYYFFYVSFLAGVEPKVAKVLTAWENPGGKTRFFPGWAILPEMAVLGNTG